MGTEISRLGGYGFRGTVSSGDGSNQNGVGGSRVCEPAKIKEKAAEEDGTRRGKMKPEPSRSSGLCLGITRHPYDKPNAVLVQQPSAAECCKKMGQ